MTVVKLSRTDANRKLKAKSTLNFRQFTSSFAASVKTEKNFTQEFIEEKFGKERFGVIAMFTSFTE